ncbi:hypothetical protein Tco_1329755 [Tanacetum coccineum]
MVAYLKKPDGGEEFQQIVDFLNASHLREVELTATIDGKVKIVTETSVRRHLRLADSDGISSLPNTEIFEQLSLMGRTIRQEFIVPQPRSPTQTYVIDEATSTGVDVRYGGTATIVTGLEAGQGSELAVLYTTLSKKVESLETDLKQTKLTYGAANTKLIKKVKKLENKVKSNQARRRAKIIISDDEEDLEDPSEQGRKISEIDQDPTISLDVSTAEEDISTAMPVFTAGSAVTIASVDVSTATVSTYKDKEKKHMGAYTLQQLRSYSFDEIKNLFETTMRRVHTFVPMDSEIERAIPESTARSLKRDAEEELDQESSKRQKTGESSVSAEEPKDKEEELSQERLQ